jgi:hypothetical protein
VRAIARDNPPSKQLSPPSTRRSIRVSAGWSRGRSEADVMEQALAVAEAEQQRADERRTLIAAEAPTTATLRSVPD